MLLLQTMNKVVFIREAVSEDVANNMIALTLYLDSLDKKRIYYWLNCPGGDVSSTSLFDGRLGATIITHKCHSPLLRSLDESLLISMQEWSSRGFCQGT